MSDEESEGTPPRPSELSKVPSWILLGFVLGALFVLLFKLRVAKPTATVQPVTAPIEAVATQSTPTPPAKARIDPPLSDLEAVWAAYGNFAVWEGDVTEVAMWNTETRTFRDCFEVRRHGDQVFFRTISRLTRPPVDRGLPTSAPMLFTGPASRGRSP